MKIDLCDGKYTYILDENAGVQEVLRYGEPWRKEDLIGDNLVLSMAQRITELESFLCLIEESLASVVSGNSTSLNQMIDELHQEM